MVVKCESRARIPIELMDYLYITLQALHIFTR